MENRYLKNLIADYIANNEGTSFVELESIFEKQGYDYKGQIAFANAEYPNILYWSGWNQEAMDIIIELINEKRIDIEQCLEEVYLIDGKCLKFPQPKNKINNDQEYWIPIIFNTVKGE
ncbi:pathogenicity island protein [Staphylococcus cohnii]|uniref:pathogenicity island protein n=1 Tax=Staphylococcus TaxID=1279 RepID=UPI001CCD823E|nr:MULTISPECIES: pathogenicity island protein [Staphylococcus]MBZ8172668.1 pathogenicity island protein [Staphylococcus cohnii]MEB7675188.1 pathogenicity island protein [Staphylococcus equorum]